MPSNRLHLTLALGIGWALVGHQYAVEGSEFGPVAELLKQHCVECHGQDAPEAGLDLASLVSSSQIDKQFQTWRRIGRMLKAERMPPPEVEQPTATERSQAIRLIDQEILRVARQHAHLPGPVTIRRLTAAEYAYTIQDLTGLDLNLERDFVSDAVGGEGFTNVGQVQFMQDSTLERYLSAAKKVADHAVIGAGPLRFYQDPGNTGFELSAIHRILAIYRQHGFRTASGEGGEAYGLDRYQRAFLVAWKYRFREELRRSDATLAAFAAEETIDAGFAAYIWSVLNDDSASFPTSDIVTRWQALPPPNKSAKVAVIRRRCQALQDKLQEWQNHLGENPDAKEEARILAERSFRVSEQKTFEMGINWPKGTTVAHLTFAIESADDQERANTVVVWHQPEIQFRIPDQVLKDPRPLHNVLSPQSAAQLQFGKHPQAASVAATDFVSLGTQPITIKLPIIEGATSAKLTVTAQLDTESGDDRVIRCTISQQEETDQGKSVSALLASPTSESFRKWKTGVLEFARRLPQISHREPAPSDRDPIPAPFDPTYNNPQRNYFHARVKYERDDGFLVEHIIDEETRRRLDLAWFDLLGSFDYHDAFLKGVDDNYGLQLAREGITSLVTRDLSSLPDGAKAYVQKLVDNHQAIQAAFKAAEAEHLQDVFRFAERAWRRPVSPPEQLRLQQFYADVRAEGREHRAAVRAVLARVLVSPAFLYRGERATPHGQVVPLNDWELANRLSFFLWSSTPDQQLRELAGQGFLKDPDQLSRQARRMLQDPKARRLATEFFGQWFGFYHFDRYQGVDRNRFPEFTDELRAAMHAESVAFFDHIVRQDRPLDEILFANYTYLDRQLAEHYAIHHATDESQPTRIQFSPGNSRGGLFGLGAVLTVTSAPRRTSPVKRGDWVLRRVLGTPVPPPPADAGSISPDDVTADGKTIRERLAAHRRDATCRNCHSRIDPLGFTLENFDAIGRWRATYRDNQPIEATGQLQDGTHLAGPGGLRQYLQDNRPLFHRTLSTKLAGYAFGRRESISDVALIESMIAELEQDGRMSVLVDLIVRSPQFRDRQ